MRKFLIILLSIILLFSCSDEKKETLDNKPVQTVPVEAESGPRKLLEYKFKPGDEFNYRLTTEMNSTQHVEADTAMNTSMNQWTQYEFKLNVEKVAGDGIADIKVRVNAVRAKADANGQKVEYDSKYLYSTRERQLFMDYESIKNKSYSIKVTKHGQLIDITGVKPIINEMLVIQNSKESMSKEQLEAFEQEFILSGIAPLTEQLFRKTSEQVVGINSKWEQRYPSVLAGFQIENIATFRLKEYYKEGNDTLALCDAFLSITWQGENQVNQEGVNYNFSDPDISGSGQFRFNVDKGVVEFSETNVKMEIEMTAEGLDKDNNPIKVYKKDFVNNKSKLELI
ncbi:MAG: hypothetical protein JW995_07505 [Melioribacteraceae bacterium]|nr:hypothetical protein [Melioribacteraceae bacterium]